MRDKAQILLEQAYQKIYESETGMGISDHEGTSPNPDASADKKLRSKLRDLLVGAAKRGELSEGLAERNIESILDTIMQDVQEHIDATSSSSPKEDKPIINYHNRVSPRQPGLNPLDGRKLPPLQ